MAKTWFLIWLSQKGLLHGLHKLKQLLEDSLAYRWWRSCGTVHKARFSSLLLPIFYKERRTKICMTRPHLGILVSIFWKRIKHLLLQQSDNWILSLYLLYSILIWCWAHQHETSYAIPECVLFSFFFFFI